MHFIPVFCRRQTLFKGLERVEYNDTDGFTGHAWTVDKDQEAATVAVGKNPWALRQHQREINRTLQGDTLRKEVDMLQLCEEIGVKSHGNHINNEQITKGIYVDSLAYSLSFRTLFLRQPHSQACWFKPSESFMKRF